MKHSIFTAIIIFLLFFSSSASCQDSEVTIIIHLRGVYESKISIMGLTPSGTIKAFLEKNGIKAGETAEFTIPKDRLPGEFVLRFDYKENPGSTPYPSEKSILAGRQNLELHVNPKYSNNQDSTWFQPGEQENNAYTSFQKENTARKQKLALLQQFLMEYDDPGSGFYKEGIREYEKRRNEYNRWLQGMISKDKHLFAGSLYGFQYVQAVDWTGSEEERRISLISHYFEGLSLQEPVITRTSRMNEWMNGYVNLHAQTATTMAIRDSVISVAAVSAIENARKGHPEVYGWMVDYFYRGFEANNIPAGMKVLQAYLDDPNCKTTKRKEIERRLEGMRTLVIGSRAPEIELPESSSQNFRLSDYRVNSPFLLLVFWSADCSHCMETVNRIYPWSLKPGIQNKMQVLAVSLDETITEVQKWELKKTELAAWKHLRAQEGVRSKVASDYYLLATPVMILLDAGTHEIVSMPATPEELARFME